MLINEGRSPMFLIHDWQRQYADALLESNRDELAKRISWSKRAIAARTLQQQGCVTPEVEGLDLQNALAELTLMSRRLYRPIQYYRALAQANGR
jgi:hypothetical protein